MMTQQPPAGRSVLTLPAGRARVLTEGALAGALALAILLGLRLALDRAGFLEAVADGFTRFIPLSLFDAGIQLLGPGAKALVFAGICGAVVVAGALVGLLAQRFRLGGAIVDGLLLGMAAIAVAELVVLPLFGAGFAGGNLLDDGVALHGPITLAGLAYGLMVAGLRDGWITPQPVRASSPAADASAGTASGLARRTLLGRALAVVGVVSLGGSALALVREFTLIARPSNGPADGSTGDGVGAGASPEPSGQPADPFGPTAALTPYDQFYVVQKNFISPHVDGTSWRLRVDGLVDTPHDWSMDELRALPAASDYRTLECISNDVPGGGTLISNGKWTGIPVSTLLGRAGVQAAATWILWESADGYTESIPLDVAMQPDSWIAYELNDKPLNDDHGFPARVLIAGRFGMKQPKWLTRIQLADHDEQGYWEQRGWSEQAMVLNMSRIDFPQNGSSVTAGAPLTVTGIAYAGDRGIARVEVSSDDGATWTSAQLEDASQDPLGPLTWVRWHADVTVPTAARGSTLRMVVRATSQDGQVQDGTERNALPSGATGWAAVRVAVS
jgi:DMSO/TMAO reductase YedYZ molybdopterin-dependent catalytic subunit